MREIDSISALERLDHKLQHTVIQGLDLSHLDWNKVDCTGATFLGCQFPSSISACDLADKGALIFPEIPNLPYKPYRHKLYTREELMEGWVADDKNGHGSIDEIIYLHFEKHGRDKPPVLEALAQRLHDHAIDDTLGGLLEGRTDSSGKKKVVGIMGGHSTLRTDPWFKETARFARLMTREGFFIATGGGPGIMEAGNLGAWLAELNDDDFESALTSLEAAPHYTDKGYVQLATDLVEKYPNGQASLAVPTWFYGHEPTNAFATSVAKYFSNSLREDGLLAIATYGILYAPGSAGTTQEVFQDAAQNHYNTYGLISPMVFLNKDRYGTNSDIYSCLQKQAEGKPYSKSLHLTNTAKEAAEFILSQPPLKPEIT